MEAASDAEGRRDLGNNDRVIQSLRRRRRRSVEESSTSEFARSFGSGILLGVASHIVAIIYMTFASDGLWAVPLAWLFLGILQIYYMPLLIAALALTRRADAAWGVTVVAWVSCVPLIFLLR